MIVLYGSALRRKHQMTKPDDLSSTKNVEGTAEQRNALRRSMLAARKAIPPEIRVQADAAINARIRNILSGIKGSYTIAGYITDGTEPDLAPVLNEALAQGNTLCLPRYVSAEKYDFAFADSLGFSNAKFGIPEPGPDAPAADLQVLNDAIWLIPGVVFDPSCARMGRGKGVYDRMLEAAQPKLAIGIFYECQNGIRIPAQPHDRPMDIIVTESRVITRSGFINPLLQGE